MNLILKILIPLLINFRISSSFSSWMISEDEINQ